MFWSKYLSLNDLINAFSASILPLMRKEQSGVNLVNPSNPFLATIPRSKPSINRSRWRYLTHNVQLSWVLFLDVSPTFALFLCGVRTNSDSLLLDIDDFCPTIRSLFDSRLKSSSRSTSLIFDSGHYPLSSDLSWSHHKPFLIVTVEFRQLTL